MCTHVSYKSHHRDTSMIHTNITHCPPLYVSGESVGVYKSNDHWIKYKDIQEQLFSNSDDEMNKDLVSLMMQ